MWFFRGYCDDGSGLAIAHWSSFDDRLTGNHQGFALKVPRWPTLISINEVVKSSAWIFLGGEDAKALPNLA